jgi:hypothetical protein
MELDELLRKEGLDAAGVADALAWARRRAAELVREVDGDPELGPLLGGVASVAVAEQAVPEEPIPVVRPQRVTQTQPLYADLRGLQAAFLAEEAEEEAEELPEVGAVLRAFKKGRGGAASKAAAQRAADAARTESFAATESAQTAPASDVPREAVTAGTMADAATADAATADADRAAAAATDAPAVGVVDRAESAEAAHVGAEAAHAEAADHAEAAHAEAAEAAHAAAAMDDDGAAAHGVPAPPEVDLDPLAGIDFDDLPGAEEAEDDDDHTYVDLPSPTAASMRQRGSDAELDGRVTMVPGDGPDTTLPSMQPPSTDAWRAPDDDALPSGELTERAMNPLLQAETPGELSVTAKAPNPLPAASPEPAPAAPAQVERPAESEEIELLDDEDLLLMEEEPEEEPEWKQALVNAGAGDDDGDA